MIARLVICSSPETLRCNLEGYRTNHPDILYFKAGEKLGIAEARKIKEHFSLKPFSGKGRTAVIEDAPVMTEEAQNALLKIIEELPEHAVFILAAATESAFLPTILSRCRIEYLTGKKPEEKTLDIENLLNSSLEERFEYVEKSKTREQILHELALYFQKNLIKYPDFCAKILEGEKWVKQNVSIRTVLEYLMLEMPARK